MKIAINLKSTGIDKHAKDNTVLNSRSSKEFVATGGKSLGEFDTLKTANFIAANINNFFNRNKTKPVQITLPKTRNVKNLLSEFTLVVDFSNKTKKPIGDELNDLFDKFGTSKVWGKDYEKTGKMFPPMITRNRITCKKTKKGFKVTTVQGDYFKQYPEGRVLDNDEAISMLKDALSLKAAPSGYL